MQFTQEKYDEVYEIVKQHYLEYIKHYVPTLIFIINDKTITEIGNEKINVNILINSLIRCAEYNEYSFKSFVPTPKGDYVLTLKRNS